MKGTGIVSTVIITILKFLVLCVLAFCIYKLVPKLLEYKASDDFYRKMRDEAITEIPDESENLYDETESETETESKKHKKKKKDDKKYLKIDWEKFKGTDIVGWLQLDNISYPILHSDSNETYIHHLPDGSYNYGGSLFLYSQNSPLFKDEASFIYGHNMRNGSMFGNLKKYTDSKYKDHEFYIYLPDGTRNTYKFYSVISVPDGHKVYTWSFGDVEEFINWQNMLLSLSAYKNSQTPSIDEKYVLLSTCNGPAGTSQRLLVVGQLTETIQTQEKASWYDNFLEDLQYKELLKETEDNKNDTE